MPYPLAPALARHRAPWAASSSAAPSRLSLVFLLLALWLLAHPYAGIVHDARLYTAQALRELQPEIFDRDLFFAYGSQARYTVFPAIHAAAIELLGLDRAAVALVVLGHALWVAGAFALCRRLGRGPALGLMLALAFALPAGYAGYGIFAYGEGFATPRPYAEAATLLGLAALLRGRTAAGLATVLASAVLHPLLALPGLAAATVYLALGDRRWWLVPLLGVAAALVLAVAGVDPFAGLLRTMDAEWFGVVAVRNRSVFLSEWPYDDWNALAFDAAVATAAAVLSAGRRRRLFVAALVVGLGGAAISLVGADLLHNLLVIQLQTWRGTWLLHFLAYPALVVVLLGLRRRTPDIWPISAALAAAWFLLPFPFISPVAALTATSLCIAAARGRLAPLSRLTAATLHGLAGLGALSWIALRLWLFDTVREQLASTDPTIAPTADILLSKAVIPFAVQCAALGLLAARLHRGRTRPPLRAALPFTVVALVAASAVWDRRTDWDALIESSPGKSLHFAALIPPDAQVYWQGDLSAPWLLLRRASYVSSSQGAGLLFSRETALEYRDRLHRIAALNTRDQFPPFGPTPPLHGAAGPTGPAALGRACSAADDLDFIVLTTPVAGRFRAAWHAPVPKVVYEVVGEDLRVAAQQDYYLYACRDFRSRSPGPDR